MCSSSRMRSSSVSFSSLLPSSDVSVSSSALEKTETRLSGQLRERESRERLNAGGHQGVSSDYQEMVDRYYQSLAGPRKAPR